MRRGSANPGYLLLVRPLRAATPLALLALVSGVASVAGAEGGTLRGVVGPGYTITLSSPDGSAVQQLEPGTYTVAIEDVTDRHNFHLVGPGVNETTGVEEIVTTTWTVTLTKGTYTFICDPHPATMRRQFTVAGGTTAPPPKLVATVGPRRSIALTSGGVRVSSLAAGTYRLTVRDLTEKDNFHLTGPGVNRRTGIRAKATATWTLALRAGTYTFRSDANGKLKARFSVTPASS